ncbi:MAG: hypothetical protein E7612_03915 [Ruminococcaceae bacterium]|nr:hypothetical protein [Oscillospiraceae bacterium]
MKNKKLLFILIGIFALSYVAASIFFALQGISAAQKKSEYFDVYELQAEEYIKSSAEIKSKYGEDVHIIFDETVSYLKSGDRGGFFDLFMQVFNPKIFDSLEEFNEEIDMIKFTVKINGDKYEITFEKNSQGQLCASNLMAVDN